MKKIIKYIIILIVIVVSFIIINIIKYNNDDKENTKINDNSSVIIDKIVDYDNKDNVKIKNGKKINNSKNILSNQTIDFNGFNDSDGSEIKGKLFISDVSLYSEKDTTYFKFKIKNTNNYDIIYLSLGVFFYNNDKSNLYSFEENVESLKKGEEIEISYSKAEDFSNAKTFKILADGFCKYND